MTAKTDQSICVFGASFIVRQIAAFRQEIDGVRLAADIEYVHRLRVASRRLRSGLPVFACCLPTKKSAVWLEQVRTITRALGAARDTDVQIERLTQVLANLPEPAFHPGVQRLRLRLSQQRQRLQGKVVRALDKIQEIRTLDEVEARLQPWLLRQDQIYRYTPALYQLAFQNISERLDEFLSYEPFIFQPEKIAELHAMRIAAKRLRYTIEIFASLYPTELKSHLQALRKCQDLLGSIHDGDIWIHWLPDFIEEERQRTIAYLGRDRAMRRLLPGLQYFLQTCQRERDAAYSQFLEEWQAEQTAGLWAELRQTIQVPFFVNIPPAPEPTLPTQEEPR